MLSWLTRVIGQREADVEAAPAPQPASALAVDECTHSCQRELDAGDALLAAGQLAQAQTRFESAIACKHDSAPAHYRMGLVQMRLGEIEQAVDSFVMALCFAPEMGEAHYALALAERKQGKLDAALASVERALASVAPGAAAYNLRGALLLDRGDVDAAIESFERAVALDPNFASAHGNLGYLLFRDSGDYDRGAFHIERALELDPDNPVSQCNYTLLLAHRGELEATIQICDRLLGSSTDLNEARLNRALARLKLGRFGPGWDDYEARKLVRCNYEPRSFPYLEWQDEDLSQRTVLVFGEQGIGDEIMFASCFPDLIARAQHCVIECAPRLQALMQRSFPAATVRTSTAGVRNGGAVTTGPAIDYCVAAGSLPRRWRRSWNEFPDHRGYLVADPAKVQAWRARLEALGSGLKIGLSWRGGMVSTRQSLRSMSLALLEPLLRVPGAHFIDLQYGDTREERAANEARTGIRLARWDEAIEDFDQGAALVSALDLTVSVCTALVHLSGALGRPVWVMVPRNPEWRYLNEGEAMPWYPSARLFRQSDSQDWGVVISALQTALVERIEATRC
jgi:tetratricopeptide (TPR) repeat protein